LSFAHSQGDISRRTSRLIGIQPPVGPEEPEHTFFFLKGLNGSVQQKAIKAAVMKSDVILVMPRQASANPE
jgi:hypothetical protein